MKGDAPRSHWRRTAHFACIAWLAVLPPAAALAQSTDDIDPELLRLVSEGRGDELKARLGSGRSAQDFMLLGRAMANQAARARDERSRERAFEASQAFYEQWIESIARAPAGLAAKREFEAAGAHFELGAMLSTRWAGRMLDELEITAGLRGDRRAARERLTAALEHFNRAVEIITPLRDQRREREDEFFALGIYDRVQTLLLDAQLRRAWTQYLLAVVTDDAQARERLLQAAEANFRELIASPFVGAMIYNVHLGLGQTLRELGRHDASLAAIADATPEDVNPSLRAQVTYERGRTLLAARRYEEARQALQPLVSRNVRQLSPDEQPALLYFNLAKIYHALAFLREADELRTRAAGSLSEEVALRDAQRRRAAGLEALRDLGRQGGSWPALTQLLIASQVDRSAKVADLAPEELLYSARDLLNEQKTSAALERLSALVDRAEVDPDLLGEALFEQGRALYQTGRTAAAADAFDRLARELRDHAKAEEAARFAYQLLSQLADASGASADYARLAATLQNLIESFPRHPQREEATWLLALAQQNAGDHEAAKLAFSTVPTNSPHWEEAQFRSAMLLRLIAEDAGEQQAALAADGAQALETYAAAALDRASSPGANPRTEEWAAEALLNAAELRASSTLREYDAALAVADRFEQLFAVQRSAGRLLGVRIRASIGKSEFDRAAALLDEYLAVTPTEQVGGVLSSLASGLRAEVQRLSDSGDANAAQRLAREALPTFEQLLKWAVADVSRSALVMPAQYSLAQMQHAAGEHEAAAESLIKLLAMAPRNGAYQALLAQTLTARYDEDPSDRRRDLAVAAWARLLADAALREHAPDQYWQARYNWLRLRLEAGDAQQVASAIREQRVWAPELGGDPWRQRLEALLERAAEQVETP